MSYRYINKARQVEQNGKLEYVKFINEANILGSDLQGVVQLTDASGTYPYINQWTSGADLSYEVQLSGSWKPNITFTTPVFLQEFWIYVLQNENCTAHCDKAVFKRRTATGGWHVTSTLIDKTINCYPSVPAGKAYWSTVHVFRIRQENLESLDDYTGSTEWQIDFENYSDDTTACKAGFRVQYADC